MREGGHMAIKIFGWQIGKTVTSKKKMIIGETTNCVFCHDPLVGGVGCGHVLKDEQIVLARFCASVCLTSATHLLHGKNGSYREWIEQDGIKLFNEPFEAFKPL